MAEGKTAPSNVYEVKGQGRVDVEDARTRSSTDQQKLSLNQFSASKKKASKI